MAAFVSWNPHSIDPSRAGPLIGEDITESIFEWAFRKKDGIRILPAKIPLVIMVKPFVE